MSFRNLALLSNENWFTPKKPYSVEALGWWLGAVLLVVAGEVSGMDQR